jgi:phage host-nuclease inhibitor protein Gam
MNNAKNKIYNINPSNSGEENKIINLEKREISEEELKEELLKLGQEYNEQVQKCTKLHEEKIKNMKDEIGQLKNKINTYYNKNEYILKEEHDKFLNELKKKHEQELEPLKKELNDLEKFISDNFPNLKI